MKKYSKITLAQLANEAHRELDDALVILWDAGFNELNGPEDEIKGSKINLAKKTLFIPTQRDLTSTGYWQKYLSITNSELRELLMGFNVPMNKNAIRLPKGAIRKLKSFVQKKSQPLQPVIKPDISFIVEPSKKNKIEHEWKTVGHIREVRILKLDEVLAIHNALVEDFIRHEDPIVPAGPRNDNIIASAVFRPSTSIGDVPKYQSVEMSAAALLHSMVHNHPFHNGNKRTALVSMLVLLDENGIMLTCHEDELFRFVLLVAQHKIVEYDPADISDREVIAIAEWISKKSRSIMRGERPLQFRKLQSILTKYNCKYDHGTRGSTLKITRTIINNSGLFTRKKTLYSNIHYGGDGKEIPKTMINKIRTELQLSEEHGIDSAAFYEDSPCTVDQFIVKYRKTLLRLGKL